MSNLLICTDARVLQNCDNMRDEDPEIFHIDSGDDSYSDSNSDSD